MMRTSWLPGFSVIALTIASAAGPAAAAVLVSIPVDKVVRGTAGDEILVATAVIPPELVGSTCDMVGETDNQDSVHPGNDLIIRIGARTNVVSNFEDESFIRHEFSTIEELPEVIEVSIRLGRDGVSSGGFLISIECPEMPSTTTIGPTTTLTSTPTSTPTTSLTTTLAGPTTSASSPTTTTTLIAGPTIAPSVPPASIAAPQTPILAVTGSTPNGFVVLGFGLVAVGAFLVFGIPRWWRPSA